VEQGGITGFLEMDFGKKRYSIVVLGCGNLLLGDDGVGPEVIKRLKAYQVPDYVFIEDVGTGIREFLFDYLLDPSIRPDLLIVVDAVAFEKGRIGQIFELSPGDIPDVKIHDFSLHQFPTVNMLWELEKETGTEVKIVAVQIHPKIREIKIGLSKQVENALDSVCKKILKIIADRDC